nr:hypothetical protein [Tanacetum cinerariifolium]
SGILALRLVDGVDRAPSALGLKGRIRGDKNPGGRRDAGASSSAGIKSSGCSSLGTNTVADEAELVSLGLIKIDEAMKDVSSDPESMPNDECMSIS